VHMLSKNNLSPTVVPLVSIWMLTYNHQDYIQQAIDSVMMQKTSFPYRLYIGEDCSTDNTRNICIKYAEKYPGKISLYLNKENNIVKNAQKIYDECFESGAKYIAMLEGDDYWTDPYKLQKQVDFLESKHEFSLCATRYDELDERKSSSEENEIFIKLFEDKRPLIEVTLDNFMSPYVIMTLTVVFRRENLDLGALRLPYFKDNFLWGILLLKGKGACLNFKSAVYRKHSDGIYSSLKKIERELFEYKTASAMKKYFGERSRTVIEYYVCTSWRLFLEIDKNKFRNLNKFYLYLKLYIKCKIYWRFKRYMYVIKSLYSPEHNQ